MQQAGNKRAILEPLIILLAPFAPHIAEELWHQMGHDTTVCDAPWPAYNEEYLKEKSVVYAISFNGKARYNLELPADISCEDARGRREGGPDSRELSEMAGGKDGPQGHRRPG